jgi:FGFR1 oncogene partner
MSTDISNGDDQHIGNDVELRELVYQSLERDGLLTRLKAELRAAVFKTIEKASTPSNATHTPTYDGTTGRICRALVLDWLTQSHLLYTQDMLQVETSGPNHPAPLTQSELLEQLHLDSIENKSQPILHALLSHSHNQVRNKFIQ